MRLSVVFCIKSKNTLFEDIVGSVSVAEMFTGKENQEGLRSFYRLTLAALQWVEKKTDELSDLLKKQYRNKKMSDFQELEPLRLRVLSKEDMYKKEINCSDVN